MSVAGLGTLDCLTRRRDVVAMVAIDYRDALRAVAERLLSIRASERHLYCG